MIKMVFLLKRKAGMSREEFIRKYESGHAKLGEKHVPDAAHYVRRYLMPVPELFTGSAPEPEYDVITELWFDTREQYDLAMARLARPDVVAEIVADEETIFDRSKHRVFLVEEHESPVRVS
ncbi:MAG: EthD domain-containing protein [Pseudomonadota bacterium]